jgi:glycine/D-amino acid oxidase-like deaminating enzyme/nitrite reductase/ring-hydroxylating ferredoxin subunit
MRDQAFPPLDRNLTVDAVVIGGGMTGVSTAYQLKRAGLTVALVERDRCGHGDTGHTSAHLTAITDGRFPDLVKAFGRDHAEAIWDAGFAALGEIARTVHDEQIDCDFTWIPGYLTESFEHPGDQEADQLAEITAASAESGFDAELVAGVPKLGLAGVRFDGQARFNPGKYLSALLHRVHGDGSYVFEHSGVNAVTDDPQTVTVGPHTISAPFVVVATHVPIVGKNSLLTATLLQTDLYPYSSYVLAARVEKDLWPDALIWDLADPYHYVRIVPHDRYDTIILGGGDHKTGQVHDTPQRYARLEALLHQFLPGATVSHRWSGQVIETRDGLPYIGETTKGQFTITGFGGNGITFGTLGAMMARDAVSGQRNPWAELFDAGRTRIAQGLWNYIKENKDYPYYMIRDRFAGAEGKSLRAVPAGEGRVIDLRGNRVAAYRSPEGRLSLMSPVCPHLGCHVGWNPAQATWDCPCHGSRFAATGDVLRGPAEEGLRSLTAR